MNQNEFQISQISNVAHSSIPLHGIRNKNFSSLYVASFFFFSSAAPVVVVEAVAVAASAPPLQPPPAAQHWKIQLLLAKNNSKLTWMTPRAPRSESNRPRNNYATFHSIYWNCSNCSPPPLLLLAPFFLPSSFFSSLFFSSLLFLLLLLALEVPIWISTNWPELLPSTFSYSFILIRNQITDKRFTHWKF